MTWSTSTLLRPVHSWFFLWEDVIPSLYRVVAVASAAGLTTLALRTFGIGPTWVVALGATLGWIGLAVAQEHDERVLVPVDEVFVTAVRERVDQLVAGHGMEFRSAIGGLRARRDHTTTMFYSGTESEDQVLWIARDPVAATVDIRLGFGDLGSRLVERGRTDLAERVTCAVEPRADADAVGEALEVVFES